MQWYVGTSGWSYKEWKNRFYPEERSQPYRQLEYYARYFQATEVNSTFYNIPDETTIGQWKTSTPGNFRFVIKINRYFTHMKRMKSDGATVQKYESFRHIPETLGDQLGPVLVQLPGTMNKSTERLEEWLSLMPPLRYAFEFRNSSWFEQDVMEVLKRYGAALVYSHNTEFPTDLKCTANFMYIRFHGPEEPYYSKYTEEQLAGEMEKIRLFLNDCREIYVFFNNTHKAYAVENALRFKEMTGE